ncbi:MAG: 4Fe-4S dicluster domain-containing protein [Candidatus Zixiibacteriota bacterium]|nr:MAG: 4Fe-4S dicluster domain-containing protein [candidate division Zixibacteria bacterium]
MSLKRRDFLKLSTVAACLGATSTAHGMEDFTGWPDRYGMLTDTTLCIGANCRRCEEACKRVNERPMEGLDLTDNSVFEQTRRTDPNSYTVVNRFTVSEDSENPVYVKKQCMHCNEPACASACLVRAFSKTKEGPVLYNKDVCIGCRYCMLACPFRIPSYDYFDAFTPQVRKCTMCYDRIVEGKIPGCAEICPKEAITFGKRSDLITLARERIRHDPDRYQPRIYGETEVGGTSWLYLAGTDFTNLGFSDDLGSMPYPELTRGFLAAVPIVLTVWPVLLTGFYKFSQSREKAEVEAEAAAADDKKGWGDGYRHE